MKKFEKIKDTLKTKNNEHIKIDAQKWLENQEKYSTKEKRSKIKKLDDINNQGLEGKLDLSDFENLEILDCSKNRITAITLPKNSKLEKFDCSENEISDIKDIDLNRCLDLKILNVSDNVLKPNLKDKITSKNKNKLSLISFSNLPKLEKLYLGNTDEERIKEEKYNRFDGSLNHLTKLENLKSLDISNTDIYDSPKNLMESLPKSLIEVTFSKEIKKIKIKESSDSNSIKESKDFKVNLIKSQIENHFSIKKAANLPTFFERHQEELEYYDPNPKKWGLEEKIRKKNDKLYTQVYPNDNLKIDYIKNYKTEVEHLPTKLLKISEEGSLELIESRKYLNSPIAYAILSYNWGREKELDKKIEALARLLKRSKEKDLFDEGMNEQEIKKKLKETKVWKDLEDKDRNEMVKKENIKKILRKYDDSFFFTEVQYEKFRNIKGLKDSEGKEVTGEKIKDEIEKKSPAFSKTLLKAIETCHLLGIEYLWVDQLCVNQHKPDEKSNEVNQMSNYYGNSALTLIAIHKNISEKDIKEKLDPVLAIKRIINSEWFQRSWTFQEGWLSKRTVFMFDDMLVDGSYLAQVWAYNQANDVKGKYSNRQEFEDQEVKIATPIGWVRYKRGYKSEDKLTFRLYEALRGIRDRKRSFAIDGIYSILGVLPYQIKPKYLNKYPEEYLKKELSRVMKEAAEAGYLEYLSWHGLGENWIPEANEKDGSTEVWGGIEIKNEKNIMSFDVVKDENLRLKLEKHKILENIDKDEITKIGGDSVIGGVYSGTIKIENQKIKIWGAEPALESVQKDNFLLVPNYDELHSEASFGILAREVPSESDNNNYLRIGLVELTKEDVRDLNSIKKTNKIKEEEIVIISLDNSTKQNNCADKYSIKHENDKKSVFLGGTCNESTWRAQLISLLNQSKVSYFNPVVEIWNEKAQEIELRQREACDYLLYTITKEVEGLYAISEVVEDSIKQPKRTIFCYLKEGFTQHQIKSLQATARMVARNGAKVFDSLEGVTEYLNDEKLGDNIQKIYWNKEVNDEIFIQIELINELMKKREVSSETLTKAEEGKWKKWENKLKNKEKVKEVKKYAELVKEKIENLATEQNLEAKFEVGVQN
ncbi:MAG: hypothetical protein GBAus27B_000071 [Mycoplasmataceae bacterium]|nr:MAG: hypothetical protein GBAus27B_000071 [Mycoplasmataceae bacterium]